MADYFSENESEVLDMVSAKWDIDEALQVSKEEGKEEGRTEGRAEGRTEGRIEGRAEGILETFKGLVKDGTLTIETAAKKMGVTVADFRKMAML